MIITKKELDETDKKILRLAGEGMTAKEMGYELNISRKMVEKRIWVMRKYYECKSITQLIVKLQKET